MEDVGPSPDRPKCLISYVSRKKMLFPLDLSYVLRYSGAHITREEEYEGHESLHSCGCEQSVSHHYFIHTGEKVYVGGEHRDIWGHKSIPHNHNK
jgi:hypothetical protein